MTNEIPASIVNLISFIFKFSTQFPVFATGLLSEGHRGIDIYFRRNVIFHMYYTWTVADTKSNKTHTHTHTGTHTCAMASAIVSYELSDCEFIHAVFIHWRLFYTLFITLCFSFLTENVHVHWTREAETHPHGIFPRQKKRVVCLTLGLMSYRFVIVSFRFHYWATQMQGQRKQSAHDAPTGTSNMKCWLLLSTQSITKGTQRVSDSQNKPHGSADHILHTY